jgi:hypothetical protein
VAFELVLPEELWNGDECPEFEAPVCAPEGGEVGDGEVLVSEYETELTEGIWLTLPNPCREPGVDDDCNDDCGGNCPDEVELEDDDGDD